MRRLVRILATAMVVAGFVAMTDVAVTLAWKEPASAVYNWYGQQRAEDQLEDLEGERVSAAEQRRIDRLRQARRIAYLAKRLRRRARKGTGIGRIDVPRIGLHATMVEGTDTASLRKGPAHYPRTEMPGEGGTSGVAGHRTTYAAPFRKIDKLDRGDEVVVQMPYARLTYRMEKSRIVKPSDTKVVDKVGYERVVLTACHPLYSAARRYVVFAKLARAQPRGAAVEPG